MYRGCACITKLHSWIEKDHLPIPFKNKNQDHLAGQNYYWFIDRYSVYNQISITPMN